MKEDVTGIRCPCSSRKKNSPKGYKKDSPGFLGALGSSLGSLLGGGSSVTKSKENKGKEHADYKFGKYGGKLTRFPEFMEQSPEALENKEFKKIKLTA